MSADWEKLIVVRAAGVSMYPALRTGDTFLVERDPSPGSLRPGDLIVLAALSDELVLHRLLADGQIKGDRVKEEDLAPRVLGVARGRVVGDRTVLFNHPVLRALHRLQAALSRRNRRTNPLHRLFSAGTWLVGWTLRYFEERIGS